MNVYPMEKVSTEDIERGVGDKNKVRKKNTTDA